MTKNDLVAEQYKVWLADVAELVHASLGVSLDSLDLQGMPLGRLYESGNDSVKVAARITEKFSIPA